MTIEEFLGDGAMYDEMGAVIFAMEGDRLQQILDVRAFGRIQNMLPTQEQAMEFQDQLGQWIVDAINEKLKKAAT